MGILQQLDVYRYTRIDPYYYLQVKDNHLLVMNKMSNAPKYQIHIRENNIESYISKYNEKLIVENDIRMLVESEEGSYFVHIIYKLRENIFITEEMFTLREWMFNNLANVDGISPRDHYHLYHYLVSKVAQNTFLFVVTDSTVNVNSILKPFSRSINLDSFQECTEKWIIIITNSELSFAEKEKLYRAVGSDCYVLFFLQDIKNGVMKLGPRLQFPGHGCLQCETLAEERLIEHDLQLEKDPRDFYEMVDEEIFHLLIDDYFHHTRHFSSITSKQYIFDFQENTVLFKQIRKNPNCEICYPLLERR
ncbi:hypothetical protein [Sutcliffiella cohnii]|uniref:hypothetical protein n=1 Tax=Sutcliffiella cohnii TaxID=33932 RepID=UPI002E237A95|nr:hypothetical protein [Sutcliffiella cohnii]